MLKFGQALLTRTSLPVCLSYSFFRLKTPVDLSNSDLEFACGFPTWIKTFSRRLKEEVAASTIAFYSKYLVFFRLNLIFFLLNLYTE